jgi:tRNA(Ile)-lysidine synthase
VTSALHVNYGLREAAAADEQHCARLCDALGVALEVRRAQRPDRAGNLQAWARDVRYGAAAELALRRRARVAVGHTASDQAETILYRLAASPGRRALLGMRPHDGRLVRPLLGVTRDQTAAYCSARGLTWREDETNASDIYARARVRANLVPALRGVHPAAERNVIRTAQQLRDEAEVLDAVVDDVLEGRGRIELSRLAALPAALRRLVARRLAEDACGRLAPDAAERVDELLALRDRRSAELHLAGGLRARIEHGVLRFAALSAAPDSPPATPAGEPAAAASPPLPG